MKRIAIYPGTFDPITNGHLDIIERAAKLVDMLYVVIMENPRKTCAFNAGERKELIAKCIADFDNVEVIVGSGLTVTMAESLKANVIIRGIRAVVDYEYELALATGNMHMNGDIETLFLVSKPEFSFLSSSIVKEIAMYGGDITGYIPKAIHSDVLERLTKI